jgi:hypothetical protein
MRHKYQIRDEEILLLGLCRLTFNTELKIMLLALVETVSDWTLFARLARNHGVEALIYNNLEKLGFIKHVPAEVAGTLHNALMVSLSKNARHGKLLTETADILEREKIKIVLLKGMALELTVYGNCGLRQMNDVDVLTTRESSVKARKMLLLKGFSSMPVKSVFHKPILADIGKHLPTLMKEGGSIEFHHELFGIKKHFLTEMLYETASLPGSGRGIIHIPPPQLLFLYLVRHLHLHEKNNESQLRLYTDLVVLLENHRDEIINFDLLSLAMKAGMGEILAWKLEPLRDLWGISFPDWLSSYIDKWYNPASINKFIFFLKSPKDNPAPDPSAAYRKTISEIPGLHRKILYILGDLFPTFEFMKKRYKC